MFNLKQGTLIAIAAGSLFAGACAKSDTKAADTMPTASEAPADPSAAAAPADPAAVEGEKVAKIWCSGVNECKGKGGCKTAANGCAGQNACKGQGVLEMTEDDCSSKGGQVAQGAGM